MVRGYSDCAVSLLLCSDLLSSKQNSCSKSCDETKDWCRGSRSFLFIYWLVNWFIFDEETGEWTKLVTSYVIVDGVVYFEAITNDFSPFAIVYEDEPVNEPVDEPETPASPAPVLGLITALGAAVLLRRK